MRIPDEKHPITVTPKTRRVIVTFHARPIANTTRALTLREASYPAVQYIPREDVDMSLLERSEHTTHCPYKGDASYFSIRGAEQRADDAVWSYEQPYPAVSAIKDHLAFYPDRVEISEQPV